MVIVDPDMSFRIAHHGPPQSSNVSSAGAGSVVAFIAVGRQWVVGSSLGVQNL